jgi:sortase A
LNKYVYPIIIFCVLLLTVAWASGNGNSTDTEIKHYQNGEISFDYPASWQQMPKKEGQLAVFQDNKSSLNVSVSRQVTPPGYTPPKNLILNLASGVKNDFQPTSQQTIDLNGTTAYENIYKIQKNGTSLEQRELWVETNGALYSIIYQYPEGSGSTDSSSISSTINSIKSFFNPFNSNSQTSSNDVIKKSLKIAPTKLNNTAVFGSVAIPTLGVKWDIRYDTLNVYNGVYHYSESFYPGTNGSMGLLGHHTSYSAPFNHIELINPGDTIIIRDYLTQKKYTYVVVSNNDIRYDYTTNLIQFPKGTNELVIGTCWPPGYTSAERYVHCQLSKVEPLN